MINPEQSAPKPGLWLSTDQNCNTLRTLGHPNISLAPRPPQLANYVLPSSTSNVHWRSTARAGYGLDLRASNLTPRPMFSLNTSPLPPRTLSPNPLACAAAANRPSELFRKKQSCKGQHRAGLPPRSASCIPIYASITPPSTPISGIQFILPQLSCSSPQSAWSMHAQCA
ncbi:hypothetical protein EJ06DRAFT_61835 [Trichodelitschia bisporula]|uniref:Uncharacterized protein n=1 Tax=Trichodelitschia bisporula TaxID=703511 RepID=A0A6G1HUY0_9PEZI|nr:hypothetical protein EJ06DRAFT_61835 [Trichodelitschia bisporula]